MKGKVKIEHLGTNPSAFAGGRPVRAADTSSITRLVVQDRDAIVKCGRRRFFDKSPRERERELLQLFARILRDLLDGMVWFYFLTFSCSTLVQYCSWVAASSS